MDFRNKGFIPTLGQNQQTCECGNVPVLSHYEENIAIFKCGGCKRETRLITRGR